MINRAVFLDRDGVLMQDCNYVGQVDQVRLIDQAPAALRKLHDAGYLLFVVTNQSGVGRGYFTRAAVDEIHALLNQRFAKAGVRIEHYFVCPHHPEDQCDCRKPQPKFLREAAQKFSLDLTACFMIGDRASDVLCGQNAGARSVLVLTGAGRETQAKGEVKPDYIAGDIGAAVDWIIHQG